MNANKKTYELDDLYDQDNNLDPRKSSNSSTKNIEKKIKIAIVGLGGAGGNAIDHMLTKHDLIDHMTFIAANTDLQALTAVNPLAHKLLLGPKTCNNGEGSGGDVAKARDACLESSKEIQELLAEYQLVFLAAGLGGGTGTAASGVVTEVLKSMNILTVGVMSTPFKAEGVQRTEKCNRAIEEIQDKIDSLILVPNDRLKLAFKEDIKPTMKDAFRMGNDILADAVSSLTRIIFQTGYMNIDFNDVRAVLQNMGHGVIASARASGELRAKEALSAVIHHPLISDQNLKSVAGLMVNISTNDSLLLHEMDILGETVNKLTTEDTTVIVGTTNDSSLDKDEISITMILTGINKKKGAASSSLNNNEEQKNPFRRRF